MKFRSGLVALLFSMMGAMPVMAQDPAPADAAAPAEAAPVEATPAAPAPAAESAPAEATADTGSSASAGGSWWSTPAITGHPYYVSPMFSYTLADKARGTKNGYGGIISVGKRMTDGLNLELSALYSQLKAETGGGKAKINGIGVTAMVFPLSTLPNAYGLLNVSYGTAENHPGPVPNYHTTIFDSGIGYLFPITPRFLLRTEARYRMDNHGREQAGIHTGDKSAFYDGVFNIGLLMPLGTIASAAPAAEAVNVVEPVAATDGDDDGDGVPNSLDKCPNTPAGTKVNADGCPLDSDGDGVPDDMDECPNTPAGAKVLANGCALSGDCRKPKAGETVDANGCAVKNFVLKGVNFDFDSDRLTDEAKEILNQVADTLKTSPEIKVEIAGHTDEIGTEAYNLGLSERRAHSVKVYLAGRGVEDGRMTAVGYGKTQPLDTSGTDEARAMNRRVELRVKE
jgi:OOP family OmpA-OmpF porin